MDQIKSAFERAWERAQSLEVKEDQLSELKYEPEGAKLAAQFIKQDKLDLMAALTEYPEEVMEYVRQGAAATFSHNIGLPLNEGQRHDVERSVEGLRLLKRDKSRFAQVWNKMESLFAVYERERQELYQKLRVEFEGILKQALQRQGVAVPTRLNVERHPEFQQRWQQEQSRIKIGHEERLKALRAELEEVL